MKLIDKEAVIKEFNEGKEKIAESEYFRELWWIANHAPTVEVIRCKDCLYASHVAGNLWWCTSRRDGVNKNGYCHMGELRGEQ